MSRPALAQPLIEPARCRVASGCQEYALIIHDGSLLNYDRHARKADRLGSQRNRAPGYELQTALLVSDRAGQPRAPLVQNLACAGGLHTHSRSASAVALSRNHAVGFHFKRCFTR